MISSTWGVPNPGCGLLVSGFELQVTGMLRLQEGVCTVFQGVTSFIIGSRNGVNVREGLSGSVIKSLSTIHYPL